MWFSRRNFVNLAFSMRFTRLAKPFSLAFGLKLGRTNLDIRSTQFGFRPEYKRRIISKYAELESKRKHEISRLVQLVCVDRHSLARHSDAFLGTPSFFTAANAFHRLLLIIHAPPETASPHDGTRVGISSME
jgi:hypothetical protein